VNDLAPCKIEIETGFDVRLSLEVSDDILLSLLSIAFEDGPIGFLYYGMKEIAPAIVPQAVNEWDRLLWAAVKGGSITFKKIGGNVLTLDRAACISGLKLLLTNYPEHFAAVLGGEADAEEGDLFLQFALFGKIRGG